MIDELIYPERIPEGTKVVLAEDVDMDTLVFHHGEWSKFRHVWDMYCWIDYVLIRI